MKRLPYIVRCGRRKTRPHYKESQTEGLECEGWPAMAAVVGIIAARSVTTERYEPANGTRPVERAQRFAQNGTNGVNCQSTAGPEASADGVKRSVRCHRAGHEILHQRPLLTQRVK